MLAFKGGTPLRIKPFTRWPIQGSEEARRLIEVLGSGKWGFDGPQEKEFAQKFAAYCGARDALCVANGSVSLEIALRALGIGPGDEVIVPALTWVATAWAVVQVGATPVFADVREQDWCLDPASFREKITPRTRAVIPVHLYSQMAEMDEILAIAGKHSIEVIEDCAHAHGFQWKGKGAGTLGAVGSYSFQQSKVMTAGEGGALVTNRPELAGHIYSLKNCGRKRTPNSPYGFGGNYRMTDFQAAVLIAQLERLDEQLATKSANERIFRSQVQQISGLEVLAQKSAVTRQGMYGLALRFDPGLFANVPVDLLVDALHAEGIPVQRTYDVVYRSPLWTPGARTVKLGPGENPMVRLGLNGRCPVAERIAAEGLVVLHHVFLGSADDMADLAAGFAKVQANAGELRFDVLQKKMRRTGRSLLRKAAFRT
ncbi:MAG: DegT/DnrJ/EryC1/StrS family aminotransferase [Verrucomicrobiota bacterium]|nr:DegT/DnrJ/EryC1/StrS family aminotransferase [Verrucomicrobiota bacterium]